MTRKKVKLAFINNDSARKATFKKRKKGLLKKVNELSTLCGIDACCIIYSPYDNHPDVWPSALGVQRVLAQFKKMPEMEQSKKMVNQESFIRQRVLKAKDQLKKQQKDNREKEMTHVMFQSLVGKGLHNLTMMDLNDLGWLIDQYLKEIISRIDVLKKAAAAGGGSGSGRAMVGTAAGANSAVVNLQQLQQQEQQQWFMDLMNSSNDQMVMPFFDTNNNNNNNGGASTSNNPNNMINHTGGHNNCNLNAGGFWSNAFFPWEK